MINDVRQIALVGHVEEHRRHADDEPADEQVPDRQHVHEPQHRQYADRDCAHDVSGDKDLAFAPTVHPCTGWQTDEKKRCIVERVQQAHLPFGCAEQRDRQHRKRDCRELGTEHTRRLSTPQEEEWTIAQQHLVDRHFGISRYCARGCARSNVSRKRSNDTWV